MSRRFGAFAAPLVSLFLVAGLALPLIVSPPSAEAAAFVVDDAADDVDAVPGDGACATAGAVCTLRAAIMEANALAGPDTITFAPALDGTPITLTIPGGGEDLGATGDLDVLAGSVIVVQGRGAADTIIQACTDSQNADTCANLGETGVEDRVFHVVAGGSLTLQDMTVRHGRADRGGGVYNDGGTFTGASVVFGPNRVSVTGGGLSTESGGTSTVSDSTFTGNQSASTGSAATATGAGSVFTVSGSTIAGNTGGSSAVLANLGADIGLSNTTVSGNTATAAVVSSNATLALTNVTVVGNSGFGIRRSSGTLSVTNTIAAGNGGASDCTGVVTDGGHNLIQSGDCGNIEDGDAEGNLTGIDPMLDALDDNGGATQTHALLDGSPAIDAGDDGACSDVPVNNVDQRGNARDEGDACDIGAFEAAYVPPPPPPAPTTPLPSPLSYWSTLLGGSFGSGSVQVSFPAAAEFDDKLWTLLRLLEDPTLDLPPSGFDTHSPGSNFSLTARSRSGDPFTSFPTPASLAIALVDPPTLEDDHLDPLLAWHNGDFWTLLQSVIDGSTLTADILNGGMFSVLLGNPLGGSVSPQGLSLLTLESLGAPVDVIESLLQGQSCSPSSLWLTQGGEFLGHIFDAPSFVNPMFPEVLAPHTPFLAACN